ncbi:MAG: hypothetical protein LBD24_01635 [Spirochaetaceae bacterium]|nr:hypothetical protein [Spirochaetaceae bacterium]
MRSKRRVVVRGAGHDAYGTVGDGPEAVPPAAAGPRVVCKWCNTLSGERVSTA